MPRVAFTSLLLLAFLFATRASPAAETPAASSAANFGGAVYLFGGRSAWNTQRLNARLAASGYDSLEQNPAGGGLGLRFWSDSSRWIGGMEVEIASAHESVDGGRDLSLVSGQLALQAGRVLVSTGRLRTYAMLGLAYGSSTLMLDPKGLPARSTNPLGFADGTTGVTSYALGVQALLGVDYVVPFGAKVRGFDGLLFGVRAGWNEQPLVSSWLTNERSAPPRVVDLPSVSADGPFLHLVVGDAIGAR